MISYLGIDVSTSIIGIVGLDTDGNILLYDHIEFEKATPFEKLDKFKVLFKKIWDSNTFSSDLKIMTEGALKVFTPGASSINTIITLAEFNVLVRNHIRENYGLLSYLISPMSARTHLGIKYIPTKAGGKPHKEQVFDFLIGSIKHLAGINLHHKPSGKIENYEYDRADAYVVASAVRHMDKNGTLGQEKPKVKKPRKPKAKKEI